MIGVKIIEYKKMKIFCEIGVKICVNIKLLQSEIKILERDWSEKKNISENADFL